MIKWIGTSPVWCTYLPFDLKCCFIGSALYGIPESMILHIFSTLLVLFIEICACIPNLDRFDYVTYLCLCNNWTPTALLVSWCYICISPYKMYTCMCKVSYNCEENIKDTSSGLSALYYYISISIFMRS